MTKEEFLSFLGSETPTINDDLRNTKVLNVNIENVTDPITGDFNWAEHGILTPIKDQSDCSSGWAFSAVETIESAWAMNGNKLEIFSTQNLISCDKSDGGCNGGLPSSAFDFVVDQGGICKDNVYPYTSQNGISGQCIHPLPVLSGGTIKSWAFAQPTCLGELTPCVENTNALIAALQTYGPISIGVDGSSWNSYTGGVMTNKSCSSNPRKMNHAAQLVGYNANGDFPDFKPYWIVRNAWSKNWGENGYIFLEMGNNSCGMANLAAVITEV